MTTASPASKAIRTLLSKHGLTANEAAKRVGVSQSTLSRVLTGAIKSPGSTLVERLAKLFNVRADVVLGLTPIESGEGMVITDFVVVPVLAIGEIPLEPGSTNMQAHPAAVRLPCPVSCSKATFAIQIDNEANAPSLNVGDVVFFDPHASVKTNCYAVIEADEDRVIRRLSKEGSRIYASASADWPEPTRLITQRQVIAVAIFKGRGL